ncbi:MAG: DUF2310 family Zn-ribbon-containing protein [Planctomycetes bacterium]|nr:DUF2310 family Zn-ribbon-containing protein [Planctomycetota bacterium]
MTIPEFKALQFSNWNKWAKKRLKELKALGKSAIKTRVMGRIHSSPGACKHRRPSSYILFTTFNDNDSPLCCGDCFCPIPLYKIPPTLNNEYSDIVSWCADYRNCDSLQMNCSTGERFGIREMSDLKRSLSKRGLDISKRIRKLTGKPTYYYLFRVTLGKANVKELRRKCPKCGGAWLLDKPWHNIFNFRCERCFLVSNIAWGLWGKTKSLEQQCPSSDPI